MGSCSLLGIDYFFERGKINSQGQYVPKKPKYKLKDKKGNVMTGDLIPTGVFKLTRPTVTVAMHPAEAAQTKRHYIKFFPSGRCLSIFIPYQNKLTETDFNPNNSYCSKDYYFSDDGKTIQVESFVYGEGYGKYITLNYTLTPGRDSLILKQKHTQLIYTQTPIPDHWAIYRVDW